MSDFAELPLTWAQALGSRDGPRVMDRDESVEKDTWLREHGGGEPSAKVRAALLGGLDRFADGEGRHDTACSTALSITYLMARGESGGALALADLREGFLSAVSGERERGDTEAEAEFERIVLSAIQIAAAGSSSKKRGGYRLGSALDFIPTQAEWLWRDLVPVGELTLLAGREGVGKSTLAYRLVAQITRGKLRGVFFGKPREVIVVATEDSWSHTIVPRLMAAGADLAKVRYVLVLRADGTERELTFELDLEKLEHAIRESDPAMLLFDPLMSRFSAKIDTHKDADVRRELEPIVKIAHDTGCALLGLIHVNKGDSADPLNTVMGSRAFTAVARSVLFVMEDPQDPETKLFGQAKSNLGRRAPGTREFTIAPTEITGGDGVPVGTSRLVWGAKDARRSLTDVQDEARIGKKEPTVAAQAAEWIVDFLRRQPSHSAAFGELADDADGAGFTRAHLHAARRGPLKDLVESARAREKGGPATWTLLEPLDRQK